MTTFHLTSLVGSASPVPIYPSWPIAVRKVPRRETLRTLDGTLYTADFGAYLALDVPLTFINSAFRQEIHQWWADQRELQWTENLSSDPKSVTVRIENDTAPLAETERPRFDMWRGMLFLRETRGTVDPYSGGLFITDDAVWGLTDQTYNVTP